MKKSYATILAFVPLFALSACHNSDEGKETSVSQTHLYENTVDTLRVIGVHNVSYDQMYYEPSVYKYVRCVNAKREIDVSFDVLKEPIIDVAYVERGDTIIMQGNKFVKNLTQERLKNEFINGR